jgi:hypothetical protein
VAFACFGFVAWSWTENHLLARDMHAWLPLYQSGNLVYRSKETLPRLAMWFFGSGAVMATIAGWQLRGTSDGTSKGQPALVSRIGIAALMLGGAAAAIYARVAPVDVRAALFGPVALPYTAATAIGASMMLAGWTAQLQRATFHTRSLAVVTVGAVLALLGSGVMRETLRLSAVDIEALYPAHAHAAEAGGLALFLVFMAVNGAIVVFAAKTAMQAARA